MIFLIVFPSLFPSFFRLIQTHFNDGGARVVGPWDFSRIPPLRVHKRRQFFISTHNETLSVPAMRISDEDRSPARVQSCDAAQLQPALLRLSAMISEYFI
jgi:hypothetical protein